jgi:hypothetical protein
MVAWSDRWAPLRYGLENESHRLSVLEFTVALQSVIRDPLRGAQAAVNIP